MLPKTYELLKSRVRKCDDGYRPFNEWIDPRCVDDIIDEEKKEWLNKACEFLKSYRQDTHDGLGYIAGIVNDKTIEDFCKFIEK